MLEKDALVMEIRNILPTTVTENPWDISTCFHRHLDEVALETKQDCRPYLERAKVLREASQVHGKDRAFRMMHTVPIVVFKQCLTQLGIPHGRMYKLTQEERERLGVLLRHPDYKLLRTTEGKL